jgi:hypothetical protein
MPWNEVPSKFKAGKLKSSSGRKVTNPKQMKAILLSEKKKADSGITEYKSKKKKTPTLTNYGS